MIQPPKDLRKFSSLKKIIAALRDPNDGCPWDLKQTNESLTKYAIEEVYELVEAIESGPEELVKDELGDVLLQVVLHAQIYKEAGAFDIKDVIESISEKMIRRHPHVFSDAPNDEESVRQKWQEIKAQEKNQNPEKDFKRPFDIPAHLPALSYAEKIGDITRKNFDWENAEGVLEKVLEELEETKQAIAQKDPVAVEAEIGDLLFSIAQWARHLNVDPEKALRKTNQRFSDRYSIMNQLMADDGTGLNHLSAEDKEKYWQKAKKQSDC